MSRTPVHEALKLLCTEGLVSVIPRVGYVVTEVSVADVQEVFQLRLVNETLAAELAAERVTPKDIEMFERLQRRVQAEGRSFGKDAASYRRYAIEANREFHLALAALSGNQRLIDLVASLLDAGRRTLLMDPMVEGYVYMPSNDHTEVVAALAKRDRAAARDAMARHMREGQRRIVAMLLAGGTSGAMGAPLEDHDRPARAGRARKKVTAKQR